MADWKKSIDPLIQKHLIALVKETNKDKEAILQSKDPKTAQLWVAIANLTKQNFDLNQRLKTLEAAVKDSLIQRKTKTRSKKEQQEVDKLMKSLSRM